eukprot:m51a1_g9052 putative protein (1421) ;mRNA; f:33746-43178
MFAAKFWQKLLQSRGDTADTGSMMQLADSVLRKYARYMDELRNDKEASARALLLADQCEESDSHKYSKHANKSVKIDVRVIDIGSDNEGEESEMAQSSRSGVATSTGASSIKSSASAANDDVAHVRAVRNRIESIKYGTAQKLHVAVVVALLLVGTCLTLEYTLSQQNSDRFSTCVRMIDTSVGLRMNLYKTLIELRGLDMDMRSYNTSRVLSRVSKILGYSQDFETRLNKALDGADVLDPIAEFWTNYRLPVRIYVNGENSTQFDRGRYVVQQMPLWDAGISLVNHLRDLCSAVAADPDKAVWTQGDGLRAVESFRYAIDNGPNSITDALTKSYDPFSGGIRNAAQAVSDISLLQSEVERLVKMLLFLPINVLDTVSNIHDFLEASTELTNSTISSKDLEEQTKKILEACEDAVIICDSKGCLLMINPAAERLTGFSSQDVLGLAITVVLPRDFECNTQVLREIESSTTQSTGKRISSLEVKVSCKDETTRDALLSMGKTVEREAVSYALFLRDISQLKQRQAELSEKQEAAEKLLYNILPRTLVHEMAQRGIEGREMTMARAHAGATILFADIVDFTQLTGGLEADAVVLVLNGLVSEWDRLAVELGVEKIKTIGSCFMAAAGVPQEFAEHAEAMMEFAIAMLWETKARNKTARIPLSIRIGVNTGKVVAGVLGLHKIAFDLWGDTVNVAARMQTLCPPDRIQVSEATYAALQGKGYTFQEREKVLIKGKGEMNCYVLELPTPPELDGAASSLDTDVYAVNTSEVELCQAPQAGSVTSMRSWSTTAGHSLVKLTNYGRVVALTLALELLQLALVPLDLILESTSSGPGTAQHSVARGVRAAWSFGSNTGAGAAWASGAVTLVAWVAPLWWAMHACVHTRKRADRFGECIRVIETSGGLRENTFNGVTEVRGLDLDMRANNKSKTLSRVAKIKGYVSELGTRVAKAFDSKDLLQEIADFWRDYRVPVLVYVNGANATQFESGSYHVEQMPLWDSGASLMLHGDDLRENMLRQLVVVYCVSALLCVASYLLLRSTIVKMQLEVERFSKMLLFLPQNVLSIVSNNYEFLEDNNGYANKPGSFGNEAVLKEIGSSKSQSSGKTVSSLEVKVSCKDEKTRDALLSMGKTVEREAVSYALFLRDISQLKQRQAELSEKQEAAEKLLYNILPRTLVHEMAQRGIEGREMTMARAHAGATILFADIVDFTQLTGGLEADAVVLVLNGLVSEWDRLAVELGVEKIKTIGSCFMAAAGVPQEFAEHAEAMMEFAIAMLWHITARNKTARIPLSIRIGVNSGKVVAGVLGLHKIAFDLWGDTVNVAARMQTSCPPDRIQVSEATFAALQGKGYTFQEREKVLIKGKGEMNCYVLDLPAPEFDGVSSQGTEMAVPVREESLKWRQRASQQMLEQPGQTIACDVTSTSDDV